MNKSLSDVPIEVRRVVTGLDGQGRSTIVMDGRPQHCAAYEHIPGMVTRLVWATEAGTPVAAAPSDIATAVLSHVPEPGETRFLIVTFPPDNVFASPSFDGASAVAENTRLSPGISALFDEAGFHQTDSFDYGIVLEGSITLELTDGSMTVLKRHDLIVQNATMHAWRNETDLPATVAFILTGARRAV